MGGCTVQMVSIGVQGALLIATAGQCMTFWKNSYEKICNFCVDSVEQSFQGQVGFGRWMQAAVIRQGDLLKDGQIVYRLPGLAPCGQDAWAHWTNNIAFALTRETQFDVGGTCSARNYGDAMFVWEELTGQAGKRMREAYGRAGTRAGLIAYAQWISKTYYLPLGFWFSWNTGNALPLSAMMLQNVQIKVETAPLQNMWVSGPAGCTPFALTTTKNSYLPLSDTSLDAFLYLDWVIIEDREREDIKSKDQHFLMYQAQRQTTCVNCSLNNLVNTKIDICFAHPLFLIAWYVINSDHIYRKEYFNWSGPNGFDPIATSVLRASNSDFYSERDALYNRTVENLLSNLNIPDIFVYIWSFGLFPGRYQPSGFFNASRADNFALYLRMNPGMAEVIVTVLGWNYNFFNVSDNSGGPEFAGC